MTIHPANLGACEFCTDPLDTSAAGVYVLTAGWVKQRQRGGANAIALARRAHRYACGQCVDRLTNRIAIGQLTIYDAMDDDLSDLVPRQPPVA